MEIKRRIAGSFPLTEHEVDSLIVPVSVGIGSVADYTVQSPIGCIDILSKLHNQHNALLV